jgi:5-methylcytosine-specific restriction protein B
MRKEAFRAWLGRRVYQGRRLTAKGIANRVGKLPRIERALGELGFDEPDLDTLHANGRWPELLAVLGNVAADWRSNLAAARRMAPQAPDPSRQLNNLPNVARQYGHFADGKDPNYDVDSDGGELDIDEEALAELKARFLAEYPDFEGSGGFAGVSRYHEVEDIYKRPLIAKVQELLAQHPSETALGSSLLVFVLDDKDMNLIGDYRRKDHLRGVRAQSGGKFEAAVGKLAMSGADPPEAAATFVAQAWDMVLRGSEHSKPYGDIRVLATLFQALARPDRAIAISYTRFHNLCTALLGRAPFANDVLTAAEYRSILDLSRELFEVMKGWGWQPRDLWDVQGFVWVTCKEKLDMDEGSVADHIRQYALDHYIAPARENGSLIATIRAGDVHNALGLANAHANVCQALRGSKFRELACVGVPTYSGPDNSSTTTFTYAIGAAARASAARQEGAQAPNPINLILYGPPGTGKTWRTAAEAVRLCDGHASADRDELMARYGELVKARRIDFVTFHQSYSYEDFVEGLRPPTGEDATEGLRLDVHHGIFRELVTLAQSATTSVGPGAIDLGGRRFFKMSLGRAGIEDEIYDRAVEGGYITLGWGGQEDWSDRRYDGQPGYHAVFDRWNEIEPGTSGNSGNISQVWSFRSSIRKGDVVVISYGNKAIRAIGEVTGDYRFVPSDPFGYYHHRDVKWLRVFEEPIPASAIYDRVLSQVSCYRLHDAAVRISGLESLLATDGEVGEPVPYVLIIDEINRANISKVFGELITLIEPDKRIGATNELRVRLPYSQDDFGVPANLHIIGTMNTADRSIAQLDTALRRRFVFREMAPDPDVLPGEIDDVPIQQVLRAMNDRIEYLVDREHRVGHAFFVGCSSRRGPGGVDAVMRDKVIPLLQEYFFEDWGRVAAVLGEPNGRGGGFLDCRTLEDPTGQGGEPRQSWSVRRDFSENAYRGLIGQVAAVTPDVPA